MQSEFYHKTMPHEHEALAGYPVTITIPVMWGDEDSFGHVNNTVYLRWAETARVEYLGRVGMWLANGIGPIIASITCDYRRAVKFPDRVHVGTRVARIGGSSVTMEHVVVSDAVDAVAADLKTTVVLLDYAANKPVRVPDEVRAAIAKLEGGSR